MSLALRLSIGANIVLLVAVVAVLLWREQAAAPSTVAPAPRAISAPTERPTTVAGAQTLDPKSGRPALNPATIAQLEQLGITRDLLVSALLEDFHRRWDRRFTELQKRYAPKQVPEREFVELGRLRDAERGRELKAALGEAGYLAWDKEQTLRTLNSTGVAMTAAEAERAYRLQKDFDEKHAELQMAMEDGVADRADVATLQAQAQEALEREFERLFGKPRLDEMRGYTDPIADVYRAFGDLSPTPDQANAVLRADQDFRAREAALARRVQENPGDPATITAELKAMNEAREENLRRIFGAEAYDTMKRQNDPTYKTLKQYANAWELQEHEIQSVYETLHAFHDQAERTRIPAQMSEAAGQPVNWRDINTAIEQARQQTEAGLQNLIGGERLRRLKQNGLLTTR